MCEESACPRIAKDVTEVSKLHAISKLLFCLLVSVLDNIVY